MNAICFFLLTTRIYSFFRGKILIFVPFVCGCVLFVPRSAENMPSLFWRLREKHGIALPYF